MRFLSAVCPIWCRWQDAKQVIIPRADCRQRFWKTLITVVLVSGIAFSSFLLIRGIADPWDSYGDTDGALFGSIARNYIQFGVFHLKFGQLTTFESITKPTGNYYLHHPPLFPLLAAVSMSLFGESEFSIRLVSTLATFGTALLLFWFIKKSTNAQAGLLGVLLFLSYPSTIIFGRKPGYEALTLFLIMLVVWSYRRYEETPQASRLIILLLSLSAALASDWAAYFLPPALLAHSLVINRWRLPDKAFLLGIVVIPGMILGAFLLSIYLVEKTALINLLDQGRAYAGWYTPGGVVAHQMVEAKISFSAREYLFRLVKNYNTAFGQTSIFLPLLGVVFMGRLKGLYGYTVILLAAPLMTFLIFWRSLFFHLWWLQLLAAPLAILGAVAVNGVLRLLENFQGKVVNITHAGIIGAIFVPTIIGMLYNVQALSSYQIRLLPGDKQEAPDFVKVLGNRLREDTSRGDRILTNLTPNPLSIADPFTEVLPYYSRRETTPGVESPSQVNTYLDESGAERHKFVFLLYLGQGKKAKDVGLRSWLNNNGKATSFTIHGEDFTLYRFEARATAAHAP